MSSRKKNDSTKGQAAEKSAGKVSAGKTIKISSALVKTKKGNRQKSKATSARSSGKGSAGVDIKAIKRMLSWQLELISRLRALTLSALEVAERSPEKSSTR